MKISILFLLFLVLACSSDPNPISRTPEPTKDTTIVHDTLIQIEKIVEKDLSDSFFVIDSFFLHDTIVKEIDKIGDAEQLLKCEIQITKLNNYEGKQYSLGITAVVFSLDENLKNDSFVVNDFIVNDIKAQTYEGPLGLQCVKCNIYLVELPEQIDVNVLTNIGRLSGSVNVPTLGSISPYFKGVTIDDGEYVIATSDSLSVAWNTTEDDYYNIEYQLTSKSIFNIEETTQRIYSTTKETSIVYSNNYFNFLLEGEISDFSIVGYTGEQYGSKTPNVSGDGVGWINCNASNDKSIKSIFIKSN